MGRFLRLRKESFVIDDTETYRLVTVQLHARGIRERQWLRGADIKTKRQQRVQADDLLVAEIDAKVGGFGIVPPQLAGAIVSNHYFLYEADTTQVELRYLEYYLKTGHAEQDLQQFVKGSVNYAAIRSQHFPQLAIPLPPLDEQRRIVARIEMLAGRIVEAQALQEAALDGARALEASWLRQILDAATDFDSVIYSVADLILDEPRNGKSVKSAESGGVRCLTLSAVRDDALELNASKPVPLSPKQVQLYSLRKGDFYVVRGNGSKHLVGRGALCPVDDPVTIFPDLLIRLRPNPEVIHSSYLSWYWRSPQMRQQIERAARTTAGIWKINQEHLLRLELRFPSDLEVQRQVVASLETARDRLRRLLHEQQSAQSGLAALLPAVLSKAFRGELTV